MNERGLCVAVAVLLAATTVAQEAGDPVTGTWAADGQPYLQLKLEGATRVTGTTIWRDGGKFEHRAAITNGTYDPKTGALKLEGQGRKPDGAPADYVIEGRIADSQLSGTYTIGTDTGAFTFTRRTSGAASASEAAAPDALISGTWAGHMESADGKQREDITVTLTSAGKIVTGRITGPTSPGEISGGSFDATTGVLHLSIVVQDDEKTVAVFDGRVEGKIATGRVRIGGRLAGTFAIRKQER